MRETGVGVGVGAVALGLCGLRRGEVFGLAWRDVDLRERTVHVEHGLVELPDGTRELTEPKTKSARRTIPLSHQAVAALYAHAKALKVATLPGALVFCSPITGTPVRFSNFTRRHLHPLMKRAKLVGVTFHQLRHTAATLLVSSGVDPRSVADVLGHSRASTTLDLYSDAVPSRVAGAMDDLGRLISEAGE